MYHISEKSDFLKTEIQKSFSTSFFSISNFIGGETHSLSLSFKHDVLIPDVEKFNEVLTQLESSIYRIIRKYMFDTGKFTSIDLRTKDLSSQNIPNESIKISVIFENLSSKNQNFLLTNSRILGSYISQMPKTKKFDSKNTTFWDDTKASSLSVKFPTFVFKDTMKVFWDNDFYWDDNHLFLFDEIKIDFVDVSLFEKFPNDSKLEMKFRFEVANLEVLFIFEDNYQKNLAEFKQKYRQNRIDSILSK